LNTGVPPRMSASTVIKSLVFTAQTYRTFADKPTPN